MPDLRCTICGYIAKDQSTLEMHFFNEHIDQRGGIWTCMDDGVETQDADDINEHMLADHCEEV